MKRKMVIAVLAWLCIAALLFSGCQTKEPEKIEPIITWDNIPQLTYGQMEAEKLSMLPWYSGRTETSNFNTMVETEQGYYLVYNFMWMYYADKTDLSNWVLVCGQPDCDHYGVVGCHAHTTSRWLWMRDGRLYFSEKTGHSPHLYHSSLRGHIFVSTEADGSGKRLEYVYEDMLQNTVGVVGSSVVGNQWVEAFGSIDDSGNAYSRWFIIDEQGGREVKKPGELTSDTYMNQAFEVLDLRGEPCLLFGDMEGPRLYRILNDEFVEMGIDPNVLPYGGYFSGNTIRYFKENDGYYDIDVATGKAVKLSQAYIENSLGHILAPNCIIETNMMYPAMYQDPPQGESRLALFDGQTWRDVQLPQELKMVSDDHILYIMGMTSDSVFFYIRDMDAYRSERVVSSIYRIPLGEDELKLEYCGAIAMY